MRRAFLLLVGVATVLYCVPGHGQKLRPGNVGPKRTVGPRAVQVEGDGGNRRNDLEGSVWEYKLMDDSYPLSGRATIRPDTKNRGGLWVGSYDEFVDGKRKERWRIEMRKVEE